ncbi:phosphotransferase [Pseudomonas sp. UL073]|uniref:Phosphotransferase n=1 Tax=Zestomonas insulae TaxID=2809017 RepID=A0ABS2IH69_9GAMM|nr:lipopolysaccharide kinase InaA family protein [Pseudomonas insulae]MBM7061188.1 phosphotransferase [Pseudomonas insulae]
MQTLDPESYQSLRMGATVLEADAHGDKVLHLQDGRFLKLFRRKRLISSAALYPYAQRFADNIEALQQRGIPCPRVEQVYRIPAIQRDAVLYAPLPGLTLRQALAEPARPSAELAERLARFIARLHQSGVYFRSLHLGNILLTENDELGLIDVADMQCQKRPLNAWKRKRNFKHLLRYPKDQQLLEQRLGLANLTQLYRQALT